jgi:hypothetical protein
MVKLLVAFLFAGNCIELSLLAHQRAALHSLRDEAGAWQDEINLLKGQLADRVEAHTRTAEAAQIPIGTNAFSGISETEISGRYMWTQSGQEKGIITLLPDHTFESHKGETFPAYRWQLTRDQLVLHWNIGSIHYTSVEARGVYVGVRTDGQTERMEKLQ